MGAAQSSEADVKEFASQLPAVTTTEGDKLQANVLYKYVVAAHGDGVWTVASRNATFSWYDANEGSSNKPAWYLEVQAGDVDLLVSESNELQADMHADTATFYDAEASTVCKLQFCSHAQAVLFSDQYHSKLYENMAAAGHDEIGKPGDWFFKASDVEAMDWEDVEEAPPPATPKKALRQSEAPGGDGKAAVHALAMGAGANSFMVRDNEISVLNNEYGAVRGTDRGFKLTPPPGAAAAGAGAFTPSRVMLMKGETEMNMLTPGAREHVFQADLERGQVIRQWDCMLNGVAIPMADIANDTRDAQLDNRSTFLGLDGNRLCRWDQRVAAGVVQDLTYNNGKDYSRGTNFTCMATSGQGYVAVGSRDGRVRLYGSKKGMESYEFKAAITSLPGLGLPITAIDVSYDGRYIIATTDSYLLVVQTHFKDAKGADTNAFVSRMGSQMPAPRLLKLRAEDRIRAGVGAQFSKGKLTWVTDNNMTERWIAAGFGNYTVLWNFRQVKQQRPTVISMGAFTVTDHYTMIAKDEKVVQNAFLHDKFAVTPQAKNALVVATEHRLYNCDADEDSDFEA